MPDSGEPPRKFYDLKPREFERVNPPRPPELEEAAPPSAPAPSAPADPGPIDVKALFREAQMGGPLLRSAADREKAAATQTDVHGILRDNHARADAAGLNDISYRPKRASKRKRDYWILMAIGTAFLGTMTIVTGVSILTGNRGAAIPFVYSSGGLVMYNAVLWWVMWHIMEDY